MKALTALLVLGVLAIGAPALAEPGLSTRAASERCSGLQKDLPRQKKAITAQTEARDALVITAEAKGDTFEDAIAMAAFTPDGRAAAESARQAFDAARAEVDAADQALSQRIDTFNRDISWYNSHCAR